MCISALSGLSLGNSEHSMTIAWFVCKRSLIQFLTNYSYLKFSLNVVDLLVDGCYIVIRFPDTHSQMKFFWDLRRKTWVIFLSGDVERKNTPKERLVFSAIPKICINKYFSFAIFYWKLTYHVAICLACLYEGQNWFILIGFAVFTLGQLQVLERLSFMVYRLSLYHTTGIYVYSDGHMLG